MRQIEQLLGKTIVAIDQLVRHGDEVVFTCSDGSKYRMYHQQGCCENVDIEDIIGDVNDILHSPITLAEEAESDAKDPAEAMRRAIFGKPENADTSETWTFYRLGTVKGMVTIRWYGTSNGYYSESVDFEPL